MVSTRDFGSLNLGSNPDALANHTPCGEITFRMWGNPQGLPHLRRAMEEEKRELLDRMITWLEYHDIRSLIEIVLEAINIRQLPIT